MRALGDRVTEALGTGRLEVTPAEYYRLHQIQGSSDVPPELAPLIGWPPGIDVAVVRPSRPADLDRVDDVLAVLNSTRLIWTTQDELDDAVRRALAAAGYVVERDQRFGPHTRLDLLVDVVGIEVTAGGDWQALLRRVTRLCLLAEVHALVVVTSKASHAENMPVEVNGKPVTAHLVGAAQ